MSILTGLFPPTRGSYVAACSIFVHVNRTGVYFTSLVVLVLLLVVMLFACSVSMYGNDLESSMDLIRETCVPLSFHEFFFVVL